MAADDCSSKVAAAFELQRTSKSGYRVIARQPSPQGEMVNTFDFLAPDRMHNKLDAPGQPAALETIAIGRWAWANQGGGWQELQPQFAQSVTSDVAATLSNPVKVSEAFVCAGTVTRDGTAFTAYQTVPKLASPDKPASPENPSLARTVLVDPATGLPTFNLIGEAKPDAKPLMVTAYTYPKDLKIEAPDAVPAGRTR
jgi:hypothetical protein